ncbi:hypothetical protein BY996DRAFT_6442534 [Phakopsora pachyrhizi]|nr:hypothetical protein BY996DRAFT_6442534 [Phakopsora pachyrhizi]
MELFRMKRMGMKNQPAEWMEGLVWIVLMVERDYININKAKVWIQETSSLPTQHQTKLDSINLICKPLHLPVREKTAVGQFSVLSGIPITKGEQKQGCTI